MDNMTNIERMFAAAKKIYMVDKKIEFRRNDIKKELGLTTHEWERGFTGGFQGMIKDVPPLKNRINPKYRDVFIRIRPKFYTFSEKGLSIINDDSN